MAVVAVKTLGLDVGGAHLKAVHSEVGALSVAYALWRQPGRLVQRLGEVADKCGAFDRIALTMTAELCDCYESRQQGVCHVLDAVAAVAAPRPLNVWTLDGRFVDVQSARAAPLRCAAANWYALATFVARYYSRGTSLLVDTGSTTTDIVALQNGRVWAQGLTDTGRLATGELAYLGAIRTPLMALGPTIRWQNREYAIMAEQFATTGDVHLLTGDLSERPHCSDTADGRPETRQRAAARVLRMIGADLEILSECDAIVLAESFACTMRSRLADAIKQVVADRRLDRVIVAGSGEFLAEASARIGAPQVPTVRLSDRIGPRASAAGCAYALLQLL